MQVQRLEQALKYSWRFSFMLGFANARIERSSLQYVSSNSVRQRTEFLVARRNSLPIMMIAASTADQCRKPQRMRFSRSGSLAQPTALDGNPTAPWWPGFCPRRPSRQRLMDDTSSSGWPTKEVDRYTRGARQKQLAASAMGKWEQGRNE